MATIDPLDMLISTALDGELSSEEEQQLARHLAANPARADLQNNLMLVDAVLKNPPQVAPPPDFAANVMARIQATTNRQWTPWVIAALAISSVLAAISVGVPILFFQLNLGEKLLEWHLIQNAVVQIASLVGLMTSASAAVVDAFRGWFTFLFNEPGAMALVVAALALASTWIGLREAGKVMQAAHSNA